MWDLFLPLEGLLNYGQRVLAIPLLDMELYPFPDPLPYRRHVVTVLAKHANESGVRLVFPFVYSTCQTVDTTSILDH